MPELPDLEAVRAALRPKLIGVPIERVEVLIGVVLRTMKDEFSAIMIGNAITEIDRRGKFLLFGLESGHYLVIHMMLTGRLQYCLPDEKRRPKTCLILRFADGHDLRYYDERLMGKVYLVTEDRLGSVPKLASLGPEPFSPGFKEEAFVQGVLRQRSNVKDALVNERLVAGIGNAYADEILFAAGIRPSRRASSLTAEEASRLYASVQSVLTWAVDTIRQRMGERTDVELRDFLRVHRRGGQPCPGCGQALTERLSGGRVTTFCDRCQH